MSTPFDSRKMGQRQAAPQFPQRRARIARKKGGKVPGYFLGGFFDSKPGSSSTYQTGRTSNASGVSDEQYNELRGNVLGRINNLVNTSTFQPYDVNKMVAGLTPDQMTAFENIRNNQGIASPQFAKAMQTLDSQQGAINPNTGMPYIDQAAGMQTGTQAASPFTQAASRTFPSAVNEYMSPYLDNVVQGIQDASNRNFEQNTMRTINDTFSGGAAAQFGRQRHGNAVEQAVFAKTQADNAAVGNALNQGYNVAGNLFNNDANRMAGLSGQVGQQANADINTRANLGQTAAGVQGANTGTGINLANAQAGLGTAQQTAGMQDANALLQSGAQQQQQQQNINNFNYQQFQQAQQYPFQLLQFAQGAGNGWTLPTYSNTTTESTGTSTVQQPQGSPFGQIMGGLMSAASLAIPGAGGTSAAGNIIGGIKNWFSAKGGPVPANGEFATGGMVPTIGNMRKKMAMGQQRGAMPTGMPGMPPMAPPAPMGPQPNGRATPFARGGMVHDDEAQDRAMIRTAVHKHERALHPGSPLTKLAQGGRYDPRWSTGSMFLDSSNGLQERMDEAADYEARRPRPAMSYSDPNEPTGRERAFRDDPLAYIFRSLPRSVQDSWSNGYGVAREMMPDKQIEMLLRGSGRIGEGLMHGRPLETLEGAGEMALAPFGLMAPGATKAGDAMMRYMLSRGVR